MREQGRREYADRRHGFIAQSISFVCSPFGTGLTDEETPLYLDAPPAMRPFVESVAFAEHIVEDGLIVG